MKVIFLSVFMLLTQNFIAIDFYDINIESLDGTHTKMSAYKGKKVIIAIVSGKSEGVKMVIYLDSIQKANKDIQAIAIPASDFDGTINTLPLRDIKKNAAIVVTKPLKVRKMNGARQHPLLAWLTHSSENKHFNMDVEGEGQVFMVSGKGTLFGVFPTGTPYKYIGKAINQPFAE